MTDDLNLGIVIVTYNSGAVIGSCLHAMGPDLHPNVLIVDNDSRDETVAIARSYGIRTMRQKKNVGFGQAANRGAQALETRFLCFLNPDCKADRDFFYEGVNLLQKQRSCCAVPKYIHERGSTISGAQPGYTRLKLFADMIYSNCGYLQIYRSMERLPGFHDMSWLWPYGASFFIERETFFKIKGFSKRYFMYMEDVAIGLELYRIGSRIIEFESKVEHLAREGSDIGKLQRRRLLNRARCHYAREQYGLLFALLMRFIGLSAEFLQWLIRNHR